MQPWPDLRIAFIALGDLGFTVPTALAIAAALLAARAGAAALRWCLLFAGAMLLVGANKIAFMAWGAGIEPLAFKAISGHAAGATAVLPFLLYVTLLFGLASRGHAPAPPMQTIQSASIAAGLALGGLVGLQLVLLCEHTLSEVLAGCAIGALTSCVAIAGTRPPIVMRAGPAAISFGAASLLALFLLALFLLAHWLMNSMPVAWWMIRAAAVLAGGQPLHSLASD